MIVATGRGPRAPRLLSLLRGVAALLALTSAAALAMQPRAAFASTYSATPPVHRALYVDGQDGRWLLDGTWLLRDDPGDRGQRAGWWRGGASTAGWHDITVPNSANAGDFSSASMHGSVYWYRRDFTLPRGAFAASAPAAAQRWIVRFESVNYRATAWLNGRRIGSHTGAYLPFEFELGALRAGVNRLVVRVDDRRSSRDLPPGPNGGWWNFGGLQREVYLRAVAGVDISQVQVRPRLSCPSCAAVVEEQAVIRNLTRASRVVTLRGRYGSVAFSFGRARIGPGKSWNAHARVRIAHPDLWAPGHPHLYRARLQLSDQSGRKLDGYTVLSGIRSIRVTRGGRIELNGHLLNLRGVALHEEDVREGAALDTAHLRRLIGWARALHAGIIRSHYPLNPQLEEMADRFGIFVWSEVPVYQLSAAALAVPSVRSASEAFVRDNVLANQNHPSVLVWSIANELPTPAPLGEAKYIAAAAKLVHRLDPTRPAGMAISTWPGVACQHAYGELDVIGYNEYFGWYSSGGGKTDDRQALGPFLDTLRHCYSRKAIMITEFGFEADRHGPVEEHGTYEFQVDAIRYHMGVFASRSWLSGAIYFALQDFPCKPNWGGGNAHPHPPFHQKGVVDLYGGLKPGFGVLQALVRATRQVSSPSTGGSAIGASSH